MIPRPAKLLPRMTMLWTIPEGGKLQPTAYWLMVSARENPAGLMVNIQTWRTGGMVLKPSWYDLSHELLQSSFDHPNNSAVANARKSGTAMGQYITGEVIWTLVRILAAR